jgi:hypothetical protein
VAKAAIPCQLGAEHNEIVFLTERRFELPEFRELRTEPGHQTFSKAELVPEILHALTPVVEIRSPASCLSAPHRLSARSETAPEDLRQLRHID